MPYVEVDVDIDDFETQDLVDEICRRMKHQGRLKKMLSAEQKQEMKEVYSELAADIGVGPIEGIEIKTLDDKMKCEHIVRVFNKYSLTEIEKALP